MEKLTLSYVGNHDREVHDMVEILATGEVLSGGDTSGTKKTLAGVKGEVASPIIFQLVKGGSVLLLGAFARYIFGSDFTHVSKKKNSLLGIVGFQVRLKNLELELSEEEQLPQVILLFWPPVKHGHCSLALNAAGV